jgi:MarR family transcriptional regulator, 2-MHQ and catechol-resistance regulon repressor
LSRSSRIYWFKVKVICEEGLGEEKVPTHYKGSEDEVRALNAYVNLTRASESLARRLSAQLEESGLTVGQFGVLEALYHLGPMCQKELGAKLLRSGGNVTLVIENLTRHGWVRRERQASDRRWIQIHLTPKGRTLIARVFPKHADAIAREMSALEPEEQEALRRICRKLGKGGEELYEERRNKEKDHARSTTE